MSNPFAEAISSLIPEPHASLLNGMVFGIRSSLPKSLYQDLITTGTVHMIALSGMNISILTAVIAFATPRPWNYPLNTRSPQNFLN
jgi:competence protein ComEC